MAEHQPIDSRVHHRVLRTILDRGNAPSASELSSALATPEAEIRASLRRLAENHGLVLHPASDDVWIAHPFSLSPTAVWVASRERGWWAPCLWCAMGISALCGDDATVRVRLGGEADEVVLRIGSGTVEPDVLVHFPIPPRDAWTNVVHFCASVQPFRSEPEVDAWCARHRLPRGQVIPARQVLALARVWYGRHLDEAWVKWTVPEAGAIFEGVGLTGPFWALPGAGERY